MALFVLRKGIRVVSTPTGAQVVNELGTEISLSPLEVQVLARASAGIEHSGLHLSAVIERLSSLGLLDVGTGPVAEAAPAATQAPAPVVAPKVSELPPLEVEGAVSQFRTDLTVTQKPGSGIFEVTDPETKKTFSLYDFEVSLARMLDGKRTVDQVIDAGQRLGIPVDLASLTQFVRQLHRYGFLAPKGAPRVVTPGGLWAPRASWDEGLRTLFQSGVRFSRQGRYAEAAAYFETMLQQNPDNPEAAEMLAQVRQREAEMPPLTVTGSAEPDLPEVEAKLVSQSRRGTWLALIAVTVFAFAGGAAWRLLGSQQPAESPAETVLAPPPPRATPATEPLVALNADDDAGAAPVEGVEMADVAIDGVKVEPVAAAPREVAVVVVVVDAGAPIVLDAGSVVAKAIVDAGAPVAVVPPPPEPVAAAPNEAIAFAPDKRGRATMGEVLAPSDGTVSFAAAAEERVKAKAVVGQISANGRSVSLAAPISGLVFWQVSDGATVRAKQAVAKILYHEAYLMGPVRGASPTRGWKCEVVGESAGQTAPCLITGVDKKNGGPYLTVTAEPTWVERSAAVQIRVWP